MSADVEAEEALLPNLPKFRYRRVAAILAGGLALLLLVAVWGAAPVSSGNLSRAEDVIDEFRHDPCLCVFDIDRTLTGKQGWAHRCRFDKLMSGVWDPSYMQGTLLLSSLAQNVDKTFCKKCYRGIVTAGQAGGFNSKERRAILRALGGTKHTRSHHWQDIRFNRHARIHSSLVVQARDGYKQNAVLHMLRWFRYARKVTIKRHRVHFFDDIAANVKPFHGTGVNARQVSCRVRDPSGRIGGCGGERKEVVERSGVHVC